jgi:UDP-N-acetylglucosamine diphosphorylase/glucosamine-1-phosphate N-acetyltransferase
MTKNRAAIILAAGKGKRMKSELPKVLHRISDKPVIRYLMETVSAMKFEQIAVIVGYKGDMVIDEVEDFQADIVWQKEQLGTGHAVLMAEEKFREYDGTILVAAGDVPFLSAGTIEKLFEMHTDNDAAATCLSAELEDPAGYGRIVRQDNSNLLLDIVEEKDADPRTRKIKEINAGTFCFKPRHLFKALQMIDDDNVQREYYLTDTIKILRRENEKCVVWKVSDPFEIWGINSLKQLKILEKELEKRKSLSNSGSKKV